MKKQMRVLTMFSALAATAAGCTGLPHNSPANPGHIPAHRPLLTPKTNVLPPAAMLMHPGPGVDGPGPGVFMTGGPAVAPPMQIPLTQVGFIGPDGMVVTWETSAPMAFDSEPLVVPGRYNFPQGAIYRLKLTNIPGRPGVELYPTLEIGPATPRTAAYLAHNHVPFQLTEEDFDQVLTGNFVTKVIYLPDAEFQELAIAGVAELVSTRLDPGIDPIVEADRRGSILAIIRIGNKDLETPAGVGLEGGDVVPVSYNRGGIATGGGGHSYGSYPLPCGPSGCGVGGAAGCANGSCGHGGGAGPIGPIAGVTAPMYGMPITGTPIGLPGPPHIPLGVPAGLQQHVIKNHTAMHVPGPVEKFGIHVKQNPGLSYPKPVSTVHITESTMTPPTHFSQPHNERYQVVPGAGPGADCPPGAQMPY